MLWVNLLSSDANPLRAWAGLPFVADRFPHSAKDGDGDRYPSKADGRNSQQFTGCANRINDPPGDRIEWFVRSEECATARRRAERRGRNVTVDFNVAAPSCDVIERHLPQNAANALLRL